MSKTANTVMIKELGDEALVAHYWGLRGLAYTGAQVKSRKLGQILRHLDITVAVMRRRGLKPGNPPAELVAEHAAISQSSGDRGRERGGVAS